MSLSELVINAVCCFGWAVESCEPSHVIDSNLYIKEMVSIFATHSFPGTPIISLT